MFWSWTPRFFAAMVRRFEQHREHEEFLFAQIACQVVNFSQARPREPLQPKDFMPSQWAKKPAAGDWAAGLAADLKARALAQRYKRELDEAAKKLNARKAPPPQPRGASG